MTSTDRDDRYLWDRTGEPDREIEALEGLLAPLAHREAEPPAPAAAPPARRWGGYAMAAAAALAVGAGLHLGTRGSGAPPAPRFASLPVLAGEERVALGSWIDATHAPREVSLGSVARLTLDPGSRLRLDAAEADAARFYLERGRLEALVSADAKPRFFQVDTRAARCVDLGCRYTLAVDPRGVARVHVSTGQVAFASGDREVYVPADAVCLASPRTGPGTPRFSDAAADLAAALDAFDGAGAAPAERRRALADAALRAMQSPRDALGALDMLQDADAAIAAAARSRLVALAGTPEGLGAGGAARPGASEREAWKRYLEPLWR
jgi:hypothetical protein